MGLIPHGGAAPCVDQRRSHRDVWSTVGGDSAIFGTQAPVGRVALDGANEIVAMGRLEREGQTIPILDLHFLCRRHLVGGMDRSVSSLGVRSTPSACDPGGILRSRPMLQTSRSCPKTN